MSIVHYNRSTHDSRRNLWGCRCTDAGGEELADCPEVGQGSACDRSTRDCDWGRYCCMDSPTHIEAEAEPTNRIGILLCRSRHVDDSPTDSTAASPASRTCDNRRRLADRGSARNRRWVHNGHLDRPFATPKQRRT